MKIAVTADLHLTTRESHPERFQVLESILKQMVQASVQHLILAGDVFDKDSRNYSEFDAVCQKARSAGLHFWMIPGNHDPGLKQSSFTSGNVTVFEHPEIHQFDLMSPPVLFVPYIRDKNLGDVIAEAARSLSGKPWVLVGHGEWTEGLRERNPLEPGVYMPLSRADLDRTKPSQVVLGHIHKPSDRNPVWVPGSPCPLDINETGRRRFLILDAEKGTLESRTIHAGPLFLQADLIVLPLEEERAAVQKQIRDTIASWELTPDEMERVRIRVTARGYASDKRALGAIVRDGFQRFRFYRDEPPDLDGVSDAEVSERHEIAERAEAEIRKLAFESGFDDPSPDEILIQALHVIYGAP